MTTNTQQLLSEFVQSRSDSAFRELVARYVDFVYATAIRLVDGDAHRAQDVAQVVFTDLARTAHKLVSNSALGGWLHRHTCFVARTVMRGERRRQAREQHAAELKAMEQNEESLLDQIAPVLDEAINDLGPDDRDVILLRFFEGRNLRAVGEVLGVTENVAQKRTARALEELGLLLKRRGVALSATVLAGCLAEAAAQAAPAGVAGAVAGAALAGTPGATGTAACAKAAFVAKAKFALAGTLVLATGVATTVFIQSHNLSQAATPGASVSPGAVAGPARSSPGSVRFENENFLPSVSEPLAPARPRATPFPRATLEARSVPAVAPAAEPASATVSFASVAAPAVPAALPREDWVHLVPRPGKLMRVRIDGDSTVHAWQIEGSIVAGHLDVGPGFPLTPGEVVAPGPVAARAELRIPVNSLKSVDTTGKPFSDKMDEVVQAALKSPPNRNIVFRLAELTLKEAAKSKDDPYLFDATGGLSIAGVTNQVHLPVELTPLGDNRVKLSCSIKAKMTDWGVQPPSVVGVLTTADEILIKVDCPLRLDPGKGGPSPPPGSTPDPGLVPLLLKLPAAAFKGTPVNIPEETRRRAEPLSDKPRPSMMVPAGLTNLAPSARLTCSDRNAPPESLAKITDGNKEAQDESVVFLRKGVQWVQLDLGRLDEIFAIVIWHAHNSPKIYHSVVVQAASDPDFLENVTTLFNNDQKNGLDWGVGTDREYFETHEGKLIDTKGVKTQYLRFYSKGSTESAMNEYTEIEVYGRPAAK